MNPATIANIKRVATSPSAHRLKDTCAGRFFTIFYKPLRWLDNSSLEDSIVLLWYGQWVI